jgi:hypothetical protein
VGGGARVGWSVGVGAGSGVDLGMTGSGLGLGVGEAIVLGNTGGGLVGWPPVVQLSPKKVALNRKAISRKRLFFIFEKFPHIYYKTFLSVLPSLF